MTGQVTGEVLADPVGLIVRVVAEVEQALDAAQIREVVNRVAGGRAKRRRLAQALCDDPLLPVTGGPPVSWAAGQLLLGLRSAGAGAVAAPRCGECGRSLSYMISRKGHLICSPCRDIPQACAKCGNERRVVTRDRHGRPRCGECPDLDGDPMRLLAELLAGIAPALGAQEVLAAAGRATVRSAGQRRLARAVLDNPALLSGAGTDAPAPVLRFIDELIAAGAVNITRPSCPRCQRTVALSKLLDGQRVCRSCFARERAVPCSRCGSLREPAGRCARTAWSATRSISRNALRAVAVPGSRSARRTGRCARAAATGPC